MDIIRRIMALQGDTASTRLAYDGPALQDGSMDVMDLAPALMAVGRLIQDANIVLNGKKSKVVVQVQADFKEGSFDWGLALYITHNISTFLANENVRTAKELLEWIGLASGATMTLFGFLKLINGRKVAEAKRLSNGSVEVKLAETIGDGNEIVTNTTVNNITNNYTFNLTVPGPVYDLATSEKVRRDVASVVRPLKKAGIDKLEVRDSGKREELASDANIEAFEAIPALPADAADKPRELLVELIKPAFEKGLKWMFSDGGQKFSAEIKDEEFLESVLGRERSFSKGTIMRVIMRSPQRVVNGRLTTEREILEVLEDSPGRTPRLLPDPE